MPKDDESLVCLTPRLAFFEMRCIWTGVCAENYTTDYVESFCGNTTHPCCGHVPRANLVQIAAVFLPGS